MLLLVNSPFTTFMRHRHPNMGRLLTPAVGGLRLDETVAAGLPWAADNFAFTGWDEPRFVRLLDRCTGYAGCLFVVAPDVVGDAAATRDRFDEWVDALDDRDLPAGYALQDGATAASVPWHRIAAVFVGGSTLFKSSPEAAQLVAEARRRDLWAHMGRVSSWRRMKYAAAIGVQSVDGSKIARYPATYSARFAEYAAAPTQGALA